MQDEKVLKERRLVLRAICAIAVMFLTIGVAGPGTF